MSTRYSRFLPHLIFILDLLVLNLSFLLSLLFRTETFIWTKAISDYFIISNIAWIVISGLSKNNFVYRPLNLTRVLNRYLITIINFAVVIFSVLYFMRILEEIF
jgi:hypothetical protein